MKPAHSNNMTVWIGYVVVIMLVFAALPAYCYWYGARCEKKGVPEYEEATLEQRIEALEAAVDDGDHIFIRTFDGAESLPNHVAALEARIRGMEIDITYHRNILKDLYALHDKEWVDWQVDMEIKNTNERNW